LPAQTTLRFPSLWGNVHPEKYRLHANMTVGLEIQAQIIRKGNPMAERSGLVTLKGNPIKIGGNPVNVGAKAPEFTVVANDLSTKTLADFKGKVVILSAVPSLDTGVCDKE